jgi:hypothetical protein
MSFTFNKLAGYWQPTLACIGALVVAIETLNAGEHSWWNLFGASLVAAGALAMAIDQVRGGQKIVALVTGGSSFVFFEFVRRKDHQERVYYICACHQGEETVRDLSATILSISTLINKPPSTYPQTLPSLMIGNVVPKSRTVVNEISFPDKEIRFQVTFEASNGSWFQTVIVSPTDSGHTFALQVWKTEFTTTVPVRRTLLEQVDSSFPRADNGSIDWSFGSIVLGDTE